MISRAFCSPTPKRVTEGGTKRTDVPHSTWGGENGFLRADMARYASDGRCYYSSPLQFLANLKSARSSKVLHQDPGPHSALVSASLQQHSATPRKRAEPITRPSNACTFFGCAPLGFMILSTSRTLPNPGHVSSSAPFFPPVFPRPCGRWHQRPRVPDLRNTGPTWATSVDRRNADFLTAFLEIPRSPLLSKPQRS